MPTRHLVCGNDREHTRYLGCISGILIVHEINSVSDLQQSTITNTIYFRYVEAELEVLLWKLVNSNLFAWDPLKY